MTHSITPTQAIRAVVAAYGSQQSAAQALNVSQPTVSRWLSGRLKFPAELVVAAERDTGVSRHLLRPDVFPIEACGDDRFLGVDQRLARFTFETMHISKRSTAA